MEKEDARVIGHVSLHSAKPLSGRPPSAIQFTAVREQIDIELAATGMAEEMTTISDERIRAESGAHSNVYVWKASHPRAITRM